MQIFLVALQDLILLKFRQRKSQAKSTENLQGPEVQAEAWPVLGLFLFQQGILSQHRSRIVPDQNSNIVHPVGWTCHSHLTVASPAGATAFLSPGSTMCSKIFVHARSCLYISFPHNTIQLSWAKVLLVFG